MRRMPQGVCRFEQDVGAVTVTALAQTPIEDYIDTVSVEIIEGKNRKVDQRAGQWWFNRLQDYRPDLANQLAGSLYDPFHQDKKIDEFLLEVMDLW